MPDKKKTHKLDFTPEFSFRLIGISSHENDYRLSWSLNNCLKFTFKRIDDLTVTLPEDEAARTFAKYVYFDENTYIHYNLLSNRCDNGFLLEEFKNLDFIIQLSGELDNSLLDELIKRIRKAELVSHAFEIDLSMLKSKTKLKLMV